MRPDELDHLLSSLDHPVPRVDVESLVRRARRDHVGVRRAAVVALTALTVGAGVAYALPSSPLRDWVARVREGLDGELPSTPTADPATTPLEAAGIALEPGDSLVVRFAAAVEGGFARVRLTDASLVEVRGPAGATRFITEPARLVVVVEGSVTVDVALPASAPYVRVELGERTILSKRGSTVSAPVPVERDGAYLLPLGNGGG